MISITSSLSSFIGNARRYRHLLVELTKRELTDRYAFQAAGAMWAWAHPLILMLIYALVFHHIFALRFAETSNMPRDYTTYLIAGVLPWLAMQDVLGRSSDAVLSHGSYVKQIAFPVGVLPIKRALSSMPILLVGSVFILCYQLVMFQSLPWTVLLWPIYILFFAVFACGITFLLGTLGVFFRDLREIVAVMCTGNLFLLPILFLPGQEPALLKVLYWLNPFTPMVWLSQDLLFFGRIEHPAAWVVFPLLAVATLAAGVALFNKLSGTFGEAI